MTTKHIMEYLESLDDAVALKILRMYYLSMPQKEYTEDEIGETFIRQTESPFVGRELELCFQGDKLYRLLRVIYNPATYNEDDNYYIFTLTKSTIIDDVPNYVMVDANDLMGFVRKYKIDNI